MEFNIKVTRRLLFKRKYTDVILSFSLYAKRLQVLCYNVNDELEIVCISAYFSAWQLHVNYEDGMSFQENDMSSCRITKIHRVIFIVVVFVLNIIKK